MDKLYSIWFTFVLSLIIVAVDCRRTYKHTLEEIAHANRPPVIDQRDCSDGETPIFIHTPAHTSGKYHNRRMTIRRTWAQEASQHQMRVIFVIAVPSSPNEQQLIKQEAETYGDMLQFDFVENYYNLTIKNIAELKWAERHCNGSKYLVKLDDDVLLNVGKLAQLIQHDQIDSGLTGEVIVSPVYRDPNHKWHMPPKIYTKNSYPMIRGFGYIISMDQLPSLNEAFDTYKGEFMDIDDLFLTSVIADLANVKRNNNEHFIAYCGMNQCTIETNLVMHGCSDSAETETMYRHWKLSDVSRCYPKNALPPSIHNSQNKIRPKSIRINGGGQLNTNRNGGATPRFLVHRSQIVANHAYVHMLPSNSFVAPQYHQLLFRFR